MRGVGSAASAQLTWRALIGLNVQCHSKGKKKGSSVVLRIIKHNFFWKLTV